MQNEGDAPKDKETSDTDAVKRSNLFSQEEVKSIVKGFVSAWIKGHVSINFPTATEISEFRKRGYVMTNQTATPQEQEINTKNRFTNLILVCCGSKPSTVEEQEKAMVDLFDEIMGYRQGDRIKGEFEEYSLEDRLAKLEEGLRVTNELAEQLIALHRRELELG